jgi:unsaturated chondroitin disaccharide hydrolase
MNLKTQPQRSGVKGAGAGIDGRDAKQRAFDLCVQKTRNNIKRLADSPVSAASAEDGNYFNFPERFYDIGNWTSSFFTGMALLAWQETEDEFFLNQVVRLAPHYREKVTTGRLDTHHDLGFLYSLYSVALYKMTGDRNHRETGLLAAELLSARFNDKGNFIRAWGRMDTDEQSDMAIIDSLMNLPLLYWAAIETNNEKFRDVAIRHADMVLSVFVRPDDSVYHAYRFNLRNGKPLKGDTYGGCAVESFWARGTAWAIYGFALSYACTGQKKYLLKAIDLAGKFIANLDAEIVPMWDFRLSSEAPRIPDASAGSVAVCAFQELLKHMPGDARLLQAREKLLSRLCDKKYLDDNVECPGIQRLGQVADAEKMAKNAYTSWGDYFLMEALSRELGYGESWW